MGQHAMCPTRARQFDQFHVVSVNKNMLCSNKLKQYFVESKYKVVKISPKNKNEEREGKLQENLNHKTLSFRTP